MAIGSNMMGENGFIGDRAKDSRRIGRRAGLLPSSGISRRRLTGALLVIGVIALLAVALVPAGKSSAYPTREGGNCNICHSGAQTPSMLNVTGLPVGTYSPGQQYTIVITINDTNGATGQNNFNIIASAGVFTTADPNAEINAPSTGAEASANDSVSPMTATNWTVVWTAPTSGSVQMDIWAVNGDGLGGTLDIWDHKSYAYSVIPEFLLVLIPVIAVLSIVILASRIRKV